MCSPVQQKAEPSREYTMSPGPIRHYTATQPALESYAEPFECDLALEGRRRRPFLPCANLFPASGAMRRVSPLLCLPCAQPHRSLFSTKLCGFGGTVTVQLAASELFVLMGCAGLDVLLILSIRMMCMFQEQGDMQGPEEALGNSRVFACWLEGKRRPAHWQRLASLDLGLVRQACRTAERESVRLVTSACLIRCHFCVLNLWSTSFTLLYLVTLQRFGRIYPLSFSYHCSYRGHSYA